MILGNITGKITTSNFTFEPKQEIKKFDFVQVYHKAYDYVLCQIVEIERTATDIAHCVVIGYKDKQGRIKPIRIPFDHEAEVLLAEDEFIKEIIKLDDSKNSAYVGTLEGKEINVHLDLKKLLTKHVAILAKSGAGKSYVSGVLVEEILDKRVPLLIIDPHGEYHSLRIPSDDKELLKKHKLKPKSFAKIREYGDTAIHNHVRPLQLSNNLTTQEIVHLIPGKLSNSQMGLLYGALKHLDTINFDSVLLELDKEESSSKWALVNNLDYLNNLSIFSSSPIPHNELIQPGFCSIINLKGITPDVQEIVVYKLLKDLFEDRKKERIPPFFTVLEEAHNYCPERSFGETRCSKILRTIASEGRKFGMGLCVISQRPARVDKSVLSQCTTQLILKVTNPNDLKAVSQSVEGLTAESQAEIKNMPVGSALVTGVVDMPLFVNIRPRMTKHGGEAADVLGESQVDVISDVESFEKSDMLPLIIPKISLKDRKLMDDEPKEYHTILQPAILLACSEEDKEFPLLIETIEGTIISDVEQFITKKIPDLKTLSAPQIKLLQLLFKQKSIQASSLLSMGFSLTVEQDIKTLHNLGFVMVKQGNIVLSDMYVLDKLSTVACYHTISYNAIQYHNKLDPHINIDKVKQQLEKFVKIKDHRECFVARYLRSD